MTTISGTAAANTLNGTTGDDIINGNGGNDVLYGDAGNDALNGGSGNDVLEGGTGNDTLDGGTGNNTASFAHAVSGVSVNLSVTSAQFTGAGIDTLIHMQNLIGSQSGDLLTGDDNANVLDGGGGIDTLTGGGGNDILRVARASDYVNGESYDGGAGYDVLDIHGAVDLAWAHIAGMEKLSTHGNAVSLYAEQLSLFTDISAGAVTIETFGTVDLRGGNIHVGKFYLGSEEITLNLAGTAGGGHVVIGTGGMDFVTGGLGHDVLHGYAGNDVLNGDGGNDVVDGGAGNDALDGGTGTDTADFRSDALGVVADLAAGTASGADSGEDTLARFENLTGGSGNDVLRGDDGGNVLSGGDGDDTLSGSGGRDVLIGGAGADTMDGGSGIDTFVYVAVSDSKGPTHDVVVGFNAASDLFDFDVTIGAVDSAVTHGTLSTDSFNKNLANVMDAAHLGGGHAALFTASAGTLAGHTFLIVDANGVAGYQAADDYVIELSGATQLASLSTANFI